MSIPCGRGEGCVFVTTRPSSAVKVVTEKSRAHNLVGHRDGNLRPFLSRLLCSRSQVSVCSTTNVGDRESSRSFREYEDFYVEFRGFARHTLAKAQRKGTVVLREYDG